MAPVTRLSTREHAPGVSQQRDDSLIRSTAKSAKIHKRLKPEKADKQCTVPGPEHLHTQHLANEIEPFPVESISDDLDTALPASSPSDMDMEMIDRPPSALSEPQNPDGQLDHELTGHVSTILQARATREKEEDEEIMEILTLLDKKISSIKQKEQPRALSFGKALHKLVQKFSTQPSAKTQDQGPTAISPQTEAPQTYAAAVTASKLEIKTMKKPQNTFSKPESVTA